MAAFSAGSHFVFLRAQPDREQAQQSRIVVDDEDFWRALAGPRHGQVQVLTGFPV